MKTIYLSAVIVAVLGLPQQAFARDGTAIGVGTGAVAGALVAGPVGAVVGGIVGGVVGSSSERASRPRRVRRHRAVANRARPEPTRVAQKAGPVSVTAAEAPRPATTWTNPR